MLVVPEAECPPHFIEEFGLVRTIGLGKAHSVKEVDRVAVSRPSTEKQAEIGEMVSPLMTK